MSILNYTHNICTDPLRLMCEEENEIERLPGKALDEKTRKIAARNKSFLTQSHAAIQYSAKSGSSRALPTPPDVLLQPPQEILNIILEKAVESIKDFSVLNRVSKKLSALIPRSLILQKLFQAPIQELNLTGKEAVKGLVRHGAYLLRPKLDFSLCCDLDDHHLEMLAKTCTHIAELFLPCTRNLTPTGINKALRYLSKLQALKVSSEGDALKNLSTICPELQHLDIFEKIRHQGPYNLSDLDKLTHLQSIKLPYLEDLAAFARRGGKYSGLQYIDFHQNRRTRKNGSRLRDLDVEALVELSQGHLKSISIEWAAISDCGLKALSKCPQLESLNIRCCQNVTNKGIEEVLKSCEKIKVLNLEAIEISENDFVAIIQRASQLTSLAVPSPEALKEQAGFALSKCCPNLKAINIGMASMPNPSFVQICVKGFPLLESFYCMGDLEDQAIGLLANHAPRLKSLIAVRGSFTNVSLFSLGMHSKQLETLELANYLRVTDEGIKVLIQGCSKIKQICLGRADGVTDRSLAVIGDKRKNLEHLRLISHGITSRGIKDFARQCHHLKSIDLKGDNFDEDSMIALAKNNQKLIELKIESPNITNRALIEISKNNPNLKQFNPISKKMEMNAETVTAVFNNCPGIILVFNYSLID